MSAERCGGKHYFRRIFTSRSGTTSNWMRKSSNAPLSVSNTCASSVTSKNVTCTTPSTVVTLPQLSASLQHPLLDRAGKSPFNFINVRHKRLLSKPTGYSSLIQPARLEPNALARRAYRLWPGGFIGL